jgi:hypothetical protein
MIEGCGVLFGIDVRMSGRSIGSVLWPVTDRHPLTSANAENRRDDLMETTASDLMSGLTVFASAEELVTAEQVETTSPTTTVFTTLTVCPPDSDEA